jgi:large subunit ribosomal protein L24
MSFKTSFKTGDRLYVLSGTHEGKIGLLKRFFPKKNQVLVEGVNMCTRHTKANQSKNEAGGRIRKEKPLDISNVALICPRCTDPTWIRYEVLPPSEEGGKKRKVRVCKRCKAHIDD